MTGDEILTGPGVTASLELDHDTAETPKPLSAVTPTYKWRPSRADPTFKVDLVSDVKVTQPSGKGLLI
jgi:hypothetical protein